MDAGSLQVRNLATALLTAHGVPMILMGDEYGASKGGNNNTYCHDSPLNWLDWSAATTPDNAFARFFRHLVNFRCWQGKSPGNADEASKRI